MTRLLRYMEEKTPDLEWIPEYAPGEHITPEFIREDIKNILDCVG